MPVVPAIPTNDAPENPAGSPVVATQYPSWMNPLFVTQTSQVDQSTVAIGAGATIVAVGGDALRWGIGFVAASTNTADVHISPGTAPGTFPFLTLAKGAAVWLPLSQFGPMVTWEWYAQCSAAASLQVILVKLS